MVFHLQRVFSFLILASFIFITQSQEFPKLSQIEVDFYQAEVTFTNEDQQLTSFGKEFYDGTGGPRGRVDVIAFGSKVSVIYNNATNEIYEIVGNECQVWDEDESQYYYDPIFYGWLNKDPLIVGPSAPIWYAEANRDKIKYEGEAIVRNIMCDKFSLPYIGDRDNVTFFYYFANEDWTTPYKLEGFRVIIRIEVRGISSKESAEADQWAQVNVYTDFAYFRPDVEDWRSFQPPIGIGCLLRKNTKTFPKFPKTYKYSAEVVDLLKADQHEVSDIEYQQVWYDGDAKLARLDKYTKMIYTSELYDFNTGVTYSVSSGVTCVIKPLRNSFFEGYDGKMMGHLKEPGEVLGLEGEFYFMGKKLIRGIWADVFESVQEDVGFMKKSLEKLVVTVYYSQEHYEVIVDGEPETRIPVFYTVKGWEKEKGELVINLQYNIFAFDDVIYPNIYSSINLGRCFPSLDDKSYFILVFSVDAEIGAKMEEQDDYTMEQLREKITEAAKISDLRLPFMRADYMTTGVYVTGLMLDRPPALKQFWLEFKGDTTTQDPYLKVAPSADTKEKCAFACVDESDFICTGFFFCDSACFIKSKDILDPNEEGVDKFDFGGVCEEWLRAERDSTNNEAYLVDALKSFEDAVLSSSLKIRVLIKENSYVDTPVSDIVIGDGPYTGQGNQEKPYSRVISFAKLRPEDETTEEVTYVDNLNDCYKACKNSEDLSCASFSYCPSSRNKQCMISSVLVVDRKNNPDDTNDDPNCYIFSLKYLDFYDAYPGRVVLIPGADVFKDVPTLEECARKCRQAKDVTCRGFEYCRSTKECVLHDKHVLDLKPGEVVSTKKKSICIHYAAKYSADYYDMGHTLVDDKTDVRDDISLEKCAKICSEELKDSCNSFNYCPKSGPYMSDSSCALSTKTLTTPRVSTTKNPPCHHYEKKDKVDDWADSSNKGKPVTSGYTSKGFTGLVIGMLVLGLSLGAIGFVVYSYFRSKSMGEGMTVRFMKQDNI